MTDQEAVAWCHKNRATVTFETESLVKVALPRRGVTGGGATLAMALKDLQSQVQGEIAELRTLVS